MATAMSASKAGRLRRALALGCGAQSSGRTGLSGWRRYRSHQCSRTSHEHYHAQFREQRDGLVPVRESGCAVGAGGVRGLTRGGHVPGDDVPVHVGARVQSGLLRRRNRAAGPGDSWRNRIRLWMPPRSGSTHGTSRPSCRQATTSALSEATCGLCTRLSLSSRNQERLFISAARTRCRSSRTTIATVSRRAPQAHPDDRRAAGRAVCDSLSLDAVVRGGRFRPSPDPAPRMRPGRSRPSAER